MNTLLPFPSLNSIGLLSNADLGVQIYEAGELVHLLVDAPAGWYKEPAAMQWYGHIDALKAYYNLCVILWGQRGFKQERKIYTGLDLRYSTKLPPWVGDERVHTFHRATLVSRRPDFYKRYAWKVPETIKPFYPDMHERDDLGNLKYKPVVDFNFSHFLNKFTVG